MTFKCVTWRWCKILGLFALKLPKNFVLLPGPLIFGLGKEQQCFLPTKSRKKKPIRKKGKGFQWWSNRKLILNIARKENVLWLVCTVRMGNPEISFLCLAHPGLQQTRQVVVSDRGRYWNLRRSSGWIAWGKQRRWDVQGEINHVTLDVRFSNLRQVSRALLWILSSLVRSGEWKKCNSIAFSQNTLFLKLPDGNIDAICLITEVTERGKTMNVLSSKSCL